MRLRAGQGGWTALGARWLAPSQAHAHLFPAHSRLKRVLTRKRYLPREVFFGRFGFAGVFFSVWASDFGRFFPATSDSFR
jgi:hypothetical protein